MSYIGNSKAISKYVKYSDTDASTFSWVVDEDTMSSNTATKVSVQQASKAYVDTTSNSLDLIAYSNIMPETERRFFLAASANTQSITANVDTKMRYIDSGNEIYDPNNLFDAVTNSRFTPDKAGVYLILCSFTFNTIGGGGTERRQNRIYINGSLWSGDTRGQVIYDQSDQNDWTKETMDLIYLNGTSDYVEHYFRSQANIDVKRRYFGAVRLSE